ncbi:hypothetical protein [Phytohabitans houttuyneae]|uniref:Uncharacterized protein n=1 Tax=Phytohabitans houttuyneae TaxID=1076126 RepID=A0A6V8KFF7_9ACTN|nr:hypothetical protein [Phytohabitans houttuyneae]GFJ81088.1 hypothetical protein Phou_052680 [Phytohabitans houttuyneae]
MVDDGQHERRVDPGQDGLQLAALGADAAGRDGIELGGDQQQPQARAVGVRRTGAAAMGEPERGCDKRTPGISGSDMTRVVTSLRSASAE